jgi:hypothetical protein
MMKRRRPLNDKLPDPYGRMTEKELDEDAAKFDQEFIADQSRPLTRKLKARLRRASRKRGRPRIGQGARKVLVTIERDLLRRADALARRKRIPRSQLIARGLEAMLARAE